MSESKISVHQELIFTKQFSFQGQISAPALQWSGEEQYSVCYITVCSHIPLVSGSIQSQSSIRTLGSWVPQRLSAWSARSRTAPPRVQRGHGGPDCSSGCSRSSSRRLFFHNKSLKKKRWLFSTVLPQSLLPGSQTKFGLILNDNNVSHDFHLKFSFL